MYDTRRLAGMAVEKDVVDKDSGLTELASLPGAPPPPALLPADSVSRIGLSDATV